MTPIVIVDRGNCTFVSKVRNIEKLGVKLAIVIDNKDEQSETLIMSDDNTGHSVHIASFMIRHKAGERIKAAILDKDVPNVYIQAEMKISRPDNRVEYELWYSSILDLD